MPWAACRVPRAAWRPKSRTSLRSLTEALEKAHMADVLVAGAFAHARSRPTACPIPAARSGAASASGRGGPGHSANAAHADLQIGRRPRTPSTLHICIPRAKRSAEASKHAGKRTECHPRSAVIAREPSKVARGTRPGISACAGPAPCRPCPAPRPACPACPDAQPAQRPAKLCIRHLPRSRLVMGRT